MKVLLCDDSAFMRGVIKNFIIKQYGEAVIFEEAENGVQAVEKFRAFGPDLVMLDVVMPEKDGIGVLKDIGKTAKIIVVSAAGQETLIDAALNLGAKSFILKPFDFKKLQETIDAVLKG